jgi:GNAT superfamily N-acetyltransferase
MAIMIELSHGQLVGLSGWFVPERPALIALHVLHSGQGLSFADRWPEPRALVVAIDSLCSLLGDPAALTPGDLVAHVRGLLYVEPPFLPLVRDAFPATRSIDRVVFELEREPAFTVPSGATVRKLEPADAGAIAALSPDCLFLANTWGGPEGLAASGYAWGAFAGDNLASLACTFLLGNEMEDVGIATEPAYRRQGLALASAGALCQEIRQRDRLPAWTTSTDNPGSIYLAEKLGFSQTATELLYLLGPPAATA